jgi:hypothetical protein
MKSLDIIRCVAECNDEKELLALNSLIIGKLKEVQAIRNYEMMRVLRVGDKCGTTCNAHHINCSQHPCNLQSPIR